MDPFRPQDKYNIKFVESGWTNTHTLIQENSIIRINILIYTIFVDRNKIQAILYSILK